jgi:hypothetical protein
MGGWKKGDDCVLFWSGRWRPGCKVLNTYPEHKNALRVEWNDLDYTVTPEDVRTPDHHERVVYHERRERWRMENADLLDAWAKGKKTNAELAEATKTPIQGIASRVRAAKRRGLLV